MKWIQKLKALCDNILKVNYFLVNPLTMLAWF